MQAGDGVWWPECQPNGLQSPSSHPPTWLCYHRQFTKANYHSHANHRPQCNPPGHLSHIITVKSASVVGLGISDHSAISCHLCWQNPSHSPGIWPTDPGELTLSSGKTYHRLPRQWWTVWIVPMARPFSRSLTIMPHYVHCILWSKCHGWQERDEIRWTSGTRHSNDSELPDLLITGRPTGDSDTE